MLEILFRGKRVDNGEWVEGDLFHHSDGKTEIFVPKEVLFAGKYLEGIWRIVDHTTVGQYTGLTDKTGAKIFEGDIVRTKYGRACVVTWFEPKLCFDLKPICTFKNIDMPAPDLFDIWESKNLEVLGNIYDEPGLLEKEEALL